MFEPRPFSDKSSAQDNLIVALKNRDLAAFEEALEDPNVDPDYWYGKPYWSTCLQLAAKTEGCEAFVLALLRAGAGSPRHQRNSIQNSNKTSADVSHVNGHGGFGDSPHACVCGAQGGPAGRGGAGPSGSGGPSGSASGTVVAVDMVTMAAAAAGGANGGGALSHGASIDMGSRGWPRHSSWMSSTGPPDNAEQQTVIFWLRDIGRAMREMSDYMAGEMRVISNRIERVEERLSTLERNQQHTNELLHQQPR